MTLEKKNESKALLDEGLTQRYISTKLGVSKTCVAGVYSKLKKRIPLDNVAGQGRKRISTPNEDRYLRRLINQEIAIQNIYEERS